ncbi:glycosyltransferase family 4 protein [Kocuria palustris]|uniref:glycosyltransferase family 4 protein n=1 Tax=Kocuria palustris TaxID=71999 RepID=UPI0024682AFC|nr:glycosyltransferase family 4 protein [Kocuria palustris]MDH5152349.1 glycosyltransferase family 4 protein [Kocuria palustris]
MSRARSNALLLAHSYWPEHSPPQRRWQSLIPHLVQRGWQMTVVAPVAHYGFGPDADRSSRGRVGRGRPGPVGETIVRVPYLTARDARLPKLVDQLVTAGGSALRTLTVRGHCVVIVTAPSLPLLASGWLAARLRGKPLVVEMRDAWPNLATEAGVLQGRAQRIINRAVESVQDRADLVVTVTEGFAETLRERGVRQVRTVRNGVRLEQTPVLDPPPLVRDRLEVLYLGNHGESQRLERLIEAAAQVGSDMRLTLVGQGSQKPELRRIAAALGAPVRFLGPAYRDEVFELYRQADSLVVSLRDDWKSFEATVPSKTYEVMAVGRHLTAVVRGEAARILQDAGAGDVVGSSAQEIAGLWRGLIEDRSRLMTDGSGRTWVADNADFADLAERYDSILREVVDNGKGRR